MAFQVCSEDEDLSLVGGNNLSLVGGNPTQGVIPSPGGTGRGGNVKPDGTGEIPELEDDPVFLFLPGEIGGGFSDVSQEEYDGLLKKYSMEIPIEVYCNWRFNSKELLLYKKRKWVRNGLPPCTHLNEDSTSLTACAIADLEKSDYHLTSSYTEFRKFPVPEMIFTQKQGFKEIAALMHGNKVWRDNDEWVEKGNKGFGPSFSPAWKFFYYDGITYFSIVDVWGPDVPGEQPGDPKDRETTLTFDCSMGTINWDLFYRDGQIEDMQKYKIQITDTYY
jgi:hypothetical protein